jgi:hypothetical protein
VEIEASLGNAVTITAITRDDPGEVTAAGHGLTNGDVIKLSIPAGMVELDGQAARVANVQTNTFDLEGIDTSDYSAFTSGTYHEVTAWQTMDAAQEITAPNPAPTRLDCTTLIDKTKQYVFGLPEAPEGSIKGLFNPLGGAEAIIREKTKANTDAAMRINFAGGQVAVFAAYVSGGSGFDMGTNAVATATTSFTPRKDICFFAA